MKPNKVDYKNNLLTFGGVSNMQKFQLKVFVSDLY